MPKRTPGPYDEKVLPIQKADREIKTALQDVQDHLWRLRQQINPYSLMGFRLAEIFTSEQEDLEAELKRAADALANWRTVSQGITEQEYFKLNRANEEARKKKMQENRRKQERTMP